MTALVDPRLHPDPPARVTREPVADAEELRELVHLCQAGRVYDAERWIQEARPIQALNYRTAKRRTIETPLHAAVRTRHRDLVLLLLCNGYRLDIEPGGWDSVLNEALDDRSFDLFDLLLKWGADPKTIDLGILFNTYRSDLFERLQNFGIDLTKGHALAEVLAEHTSNRPLFGFAKRHRTSNPKLQVELNIALGHHVNEENEKGVQLCLWAGADPHAHTPSISFRHRSTDDENSDEDEYGVSAVYEACIRGNVEIIKRLHPDPARDDFDQLYQSARNAAVVDLLAQMAPPRDAAVVIRHQVWWAAYGHERWGATDALRRLFEIGVRWTQDSARDIADVRAVLLTASDPVFIELMKLLATADYCSPELLKELARTPSMRTRMTKVGFVPSSKHDPGRFHQLRPARSREVLKKFGVELPKPPPLPLPRSICVGSWRPNAKEVKLKRPQLFERVWSEPVAKLAAEWGISGPGLKKVCRKLQIPVPPRGYWAKVKFGHRINRPRLPDLPADSGKEIIFRVP